MNAYLYYNQIITIATPFLHMIFASVVNFVNFFQPNVGNTVLNQISTSSLSFQSKSQQDIVTWDSLVTSSPGVGGSSSNIIRMEDDDDDDDEELSDHDTSANNLSNSNVTNNAFNAPKAIGEGLVGFFTNQPNLSSPVSESSKPFEVLRDLFCHHAHLAVFMNYVISNSDPSALVSIVFTCNTGCPMPFFSCLFLKKVEFVKRELSFFCLAKN